MGKTEVIVDTCFLQKLSAEGKKINNIKRVLAELNYSPVVHPYIYEHELALHSYFVDLAGEGYLRVADYSEFQKDAGDKQLYEAYYPMLHEDMRLALAAAGGPKQIEKLYIHKGHTIYDTHKQGSSMGDVHMILMASFLQMPILLTEDSDIELLRNLAGRRMTLGSYSLQIFNGVQLIEEIAGKKESSLTIKEIEAIVKDMKEKRILSDIKNIWQNSRED